jgi:hypothetical protein
MANGTETHNKREENPKCGVVAGPRMVLISADLVALLQRHRGVRGVVGAPRWLFFSHYAFRVASKVGKQLGMRQKQKIPALAINDLQV